MKALRLLVSVTLGYVAALVIVVLVIGTWLFFEVWPSRPLDYTLLHVLGGAVVWIAMALNTSTLTFVISIVVGTAIGIAIYKTWHQLIR